MPPDAPLRIAFQAAAGAAVGGGHVVRSLSLADALASAQAPTDARAIVLTSSRAADALLRYATGAQIDLIAIGRHGRNGLADIFLGSTAQQIVSRAACPVLTMRAS